jgi:type I restriction enzyme M protein
VDVQAGDILLVRDGTYLIGTSAIVTESDLPMLFQSHLYRLRVLKQDQLNPWLLFASLNSPMVKRQIKAKQFTQDIIDTLGRRLFEIMLPLPKDKKLRGQIAKQTQRIIQTRIELRNQAKAVALAVEGLSEMDEWSVIEED